MAQDKEEISLPCLASLPLSFLLPSSLFSSPPSLPPSILLYIFKALGSRGVLNCWGGYGSQEDFQLDFLSYGHCLEPNQQVAPRGTWAEFGSRYTQ